MPRAPKAKIGDIYELKVPRGLAYFQYTHDAEDGTQLVRILPGVYQKRPSDFALLAHEKELYFIFSILAHALHKKEVVLVSHQPVPDRAKPFPIMRKTAGRERGGRITGWHIGHGLRLYTIEEMQRALYVRELTSEQKKLSVAQIWPMSTLVAEIDRGWLPELNEDFEEMDRQRAQQERAKEIQPATPRFIDHYLYFPARRNADRAAEQLRFKGWQVEVRMGADEKNWLVLGKQPAPIADDIGDIRDELEDLADEFHGEYDGWGAGV